MFINFLCRRLATWTNTTHNIPREHLLHLQVGLYSLFHRLYAMFPCNFLSYLRHNFSTQDKRTVFLHTIMVRLNYYYSDICLIFIYNKINNVFYC